MTRFTMVACRGAGVGFANDHWINRCWRCGEKIK